MKNSNEMRFYKPFICFFNIKNGQSRAYIKSRKNLRDALHIALDTTLNTDKSHPGAFVLPENLI